MIRAAFFATAIAAPVFIGNAYRVEAEQQFYNTQLWDVTLHDAGYEDGLPANHEPTCDLTSTLWADRKIVFQYSFTDRNTGLYSVLIHKNAWRLIAPRDVTKAPVVKLSTLAWSSILAYNVLSPDTLSLSVPTDSNLEIDLPNLIKQMPAKSPSNDEQMNFFLSLATVASMPEIILGAQKPPAAMTVQFQGSEPAWTYPESNPFDGRALLRALNDCKIELINKASQEAPSGTVTSPMPDAAQNTPNPFFSKRAASVHTPSDDGSSTIPQIASPSNSNSAGVSTTPSLSINNWTFSTTDEDWGKTCFVEASDGDVKVGFMGSPGKGLMGYVSGVFEKDTKATWQVDGGQPNVSNGGINDYFGWEAYEDLPQQLLSDVAVGQRNLEITPATGNKLVVGLIGANAAISSFKACFKGKNAAAP